MSSVADETSELVECSLQWFSLASQLMARAATVNGWSAPVFDTPPSDPAVDRSLLTLPDGRTRLAVRLTGRPAGVVLDDMVAGVCHLNRGRPTSTRLSSDEMWCTLWASGAGLTAAR